MVLSSNGTLGLLFVVFGVCWLRWSRLLSAENHPVVSVDVVEYFSELRGRLDPVPFMSKLGNRIHQVC